MSDRSYTRRDTVTFFLCIAVSLIALLVPDGWARGVGLALQRSVLAPLVWLQTQAEQGKTSRGRLQAIVAQRDSLAHMAQLLPSLRAENERLRRLLALRRRAGDAYVAAEVLHQTQVTDGRTMLLSAGQQDGVSGFDPVVAPEGLVGVVIWVAPRSSVAMTWVHPEFRVSAFAAGGNASGIVAPSPSDDGMLEFRGVPYRDSVPDGTPVLSSGLGGVYPRGIPVGTVVGVIRERAGWERVYRLRPAADLGSASHVLILTAGRRPDATAAFVSDSGFVAVPDTLRRADTVRAAP